MLGPSDASTETALPGFGRGCSTDGCSPHRMLLETRRDQVGSVGTGRYRVGSDGCSPHRMLLGTGRYQVGRYAGRDQVGSDGCSPHRWQGWMLAPSEVSGRYQVGRRVHPIGCF